MNRSLLGALVLGLALAASAQDRHEPPPAVAGAPVFTTSLLKTGLYLIAGRGGNVLMRFSANGLILVDGQRPGDYRALMSQVRKVNKLSDLPVRVLVLTSHRDAAAGNAAQFRAAGAAIVAQANTVARLPALRAGDAPGAPPVLAFDRSHALRWGGVEAKLMHFGAARTDGDTVVYFPDQKVVAVGELFTTQPPQADAQAGGSLAGWSEALAGILALDFELLVPDQGPPVDRAALVAFKTRLDALVATGAGR
jgi:glyoxylase-like metal-dependent hydrolase (beta-lactamase superfamily II)